MQLLKDLSFEKEFLLRLYYITITFIGDDIFLSRVMCEFKINKYLKLKLENNTTYICINDRRVHQCKYLLLNLPQVGSEASGESQEETTLDHQVSNLDNTMELSENAPFDIPPETEFWAHSSNLQAWYENDYDTRILHSNLAFPLLKKLSQAGDQKAKHVFKKEIINRFRSGNMNVMIFLITEGYLKLLSIEEWEELYDELSYETYKELQEKLREASKIKRGFIIEDSDL